MPSPARVNTSLRLFLRPWQPLKLECQPVYGEVSLQIAERAAARAIASKAIAYGSP